MKLTLAALISAFVIGMCVGVSIVHAEPLGGWDTFPGPVAECAGEDCE